MPPWMDPVADVWARAVEEGIMSIASLMGAAVAGVWAEAELEAVGGVVIKTSPDGGPYRLWTAPMSLEDRFMWLR